MTRSDKIFKQLEFCNMLMQALCEDVKDNVMKDKKYRQRMFCAGYTAVHTVAERYMQDEYFKDKELDVQREAVKAINGSVKTIITSGDDNAYAGLVGIKEILDGVEGK